MKSKLNWLYVFFLMFFLQNCSTHYFVIPKEQVQAEIKKVLVLPVYVNSDFTPSIANVSPNFQLDSKEANELASVFRKRGIFLTKFIDTILKEGEYKFETVPFTEDLNGYDKKFTKVELFTTQKGNNGIRTFVYRPKKELIVELSKKYQVDAVFYHTIYGVLDKSVRMGVAYRKYAFLPSIKTLYEPSIYRASGEPIYNDKFLSSHFAFLHKGELIPENPSAAKSVKATPNEILEALSKQNLMYTMFALFENPDFPEERERVVVNLCSGRFSCEMSYFGTKDEN
ncbi:hypothetical protein CH370_08460 [Leptospira kmetyi]|uniref:hypothetical protein n=1 Tax=Leptospira kmetyi TaxID=408139 RepID=UPI00028A347C|nr:hypothetical protein [Leptospira kmetyi]PJZ42247.1 hypothetical protein CH370_08460 [Leptospira kmetyi]TGK17652.1 hypothetical protein EHO62_08165 [Leptospira kmetyi]TGK25088.1 hypothetical protein EHO66_19770 [Leptospira kmetyi]TGL71115.1 hypothetical protein EHQ67_04410 [Leptospira kmetyi]